MNVRVEIVSLTNLQTLGVPLVEGRYFTEADLASKRRVSIINETTAKKYFKGRTAIGERVHNKMSADRFVAYLTAIFGGVALLLACLGLYGTISYAVSRRTSELGVRIALGARPRGVLWLVLREAFVLVAIGLLIGMPLTFMAARGVSSLLYGVQPSDPVAAASAALVLVLVAAVAAYLPARRASRVDPMVALRQE